VTSPSRDMLECALNAKTGDDVMGEDTTVQELERYAADLFGFERGLFVPTGTMSNLVAIMAHCHRSGRDSELIVGSQSHINLWEGGGAAALAGVSTRQLVEDRESAQLDLLQIRQAYRDDSDDHCARTAMVAVENTHNMLGGVPLPVPYMEKLGSLTKQLGIALHVDGARIFNAAAALGLSTSPRELCSAADSVSVCLSKGLGAPLGSVLVGPSDFVRLAKRARKRCGGGMRQSGVVAAMGLYALRHNVSKLPRDHDRAKRLAADLKKHRFRLARDLDRIDTNIFYFQLPVATLVRPEEFCHKLASEFGVKMTGGYSNYSRQGGGGDGTSDASPHYFRAVTHLDLTDDDIARASDAMVKVCHGL